MYIIIRHYTVYTNCRRRSRKTTSSLQLTGFILFEDFFFFNIMNLVLFAFLMTTLK